MRNLEYTSFLRFDTDLTFLGSGNLRVIDPMLQIVFHLIEWNLSGLN